MNPILAALAATLTTWTATALGAGAVTVLPRLRPKHLSMLLAVSAGVMVAAGIGSLLVPAAGHFAERGFDGWTMALLTALLGAAATFAVRSWLVPGEGRARLGTLMFGVMSAHHVPEGMAVGLAVAAAAQGAPAAGAMALVVAMAVHNAFEGAAVSAPLRDAGLSRRRSFMLGQASGLFEIAGGVLGAVAVTMSAAALPWGLGLAAGAMLVVALGDVLPEAGRLAPMRVVAAWAGAGAAAVVALETVAG